MMCGTIVSATVEIVKFFEPLVILCSRVQYMTYDQDMNWNDDLLVRENLGFSRTVHGLCSQYSFNEITD